MRPANVAIVSGTIVDAAGAGIENALVRVQPADRNCTPFGATASRRTGSGGAYEITVEGGFGPEIDGCLIVEALSGGTSAQSTALVRFTSSADPARRAVVDLAMPRPAPLTFAEAERVVSVVSDAIQMRSRDVIEELSLYTGEPLESVYQTLAPVQRHLRGIESIQLVRALSNEYVYELRGVRAGATLEVTITRDALTRVRMERSGLLLE